MGRRLPVRISSFSWITLLYPFCVQLSLVKTLLEHIFDTIFIYFFKTFFVCLCDGAAQCALGCSSPNILWSAILTQRFNWGGVRQYLNTVCQSSFLFISLNYNGSQQVFSCGVGQRLSMVYLNVLSFKTIQKILKFSIGMFSTGMFLIQFDMIIIS